MSVLPEVLRGIPLEATFVLVPESRSGALNERGVLDGVRVGQLSPVETPEPLFGRSLASMRVRPSLEGLIAETREATGRGGSGLLDDTARPLLAMTCGEFSRKYWLLASLSSSRLATRAAHLGAAVEALGAEVSRRGSFGMDDRRADGNGLRYFKLGGVAFAADA